MSVIPLNISSPSKAICTIKSIDEFLQEYTQLENMYNIAQKNLMDSGIVNNELYSQCIIKSAQLIRFLDNLNPFVTQRYKEQIKNTYFISAELLVRSVGLSKQRDFFTDLEKNTLYIAVAHSRKVLELDPFHKRTVELYKLVLMYLTIHNPKPDENISILKQVTLVDPYDFQLHYNLGFMYHRDNKLDESVSHYKLAISIIDTLLKQEELENEVKKLKNEQVKPQDGLSVLQQFKIKCLNGIGGVYYSIQNRDLAMYFFDIALTVDPEDPDTHNQIGVLYTELRIVDKAIEHYELGIKHHQKSHISVDKVMLIASMYMNMGLAKCYECDFEGAINCYNQALKYKPKLSLAYQNKLLDMNYITHRIEDPMLISKLHKDINKIYPIVMTDYKKSCPNYKINKYVLDCTNKKDLLTQKKKLNIGFVSGDFICHPVAYFIHSILNHINYDLFNVHCYSMKLMTVLPEMFPKCKWEMCKNLSNIELKDRIQLDNIDILFDLSGHTGDNRLDTFVLKPAPIQISYCGYPNSAGIKSIDYRLTDSFCDGPESQKYYNEKLIFMKNCFLAYSPSTGINKLPELSTQPIVKNKYITFGSFNRFNKINEIVIDTWEQILVKCPTARFIIKTKEFETKKIKQMFLDSFKDKSVLDRIEVIDYADTYIEHLNIYNKIDITLDTFPYSGTTTSCEALGMGCPILTLFDNIRHYHSQNVTTSLMKNCKMDEFVTYSRQEYIDKAVWFSEHPEEITNLKERTRNNFKNSPICNYSEFNDNFADLLIDIYKNHKW